MGYDYYVAGVIRLKPKLSAKAIRQLEEGDGNLEFTEGGEEDSVGLVKGEITVIPGDSWTAVSVSGDGSIKYAADELVPALQQVADLAKREGCTIEGALYCDGEESPDLSRFTIVDFKAREEHPTFLWPGGDRGWVNGRYAQDP